ncbi:organic cation transporter 1-like [Maniola hyperantus]|uniref:organic cation transporter 1-like n=1 Tax=Aphantopus hyperantus TaxID=2795564 RepID=UPI00156A4509|nr:organic cation transporter 1-like [Maniola hyperantus]
MTWTKELDEAAVLATKRGCYHVLLFYLLCGIAAIPTSFLVFSQVFTNATPEHWCAPPTELEGLAFPDEMLRNLTVPQENGVHDTCRSYSLDLQALYVDLEDYFGIKNFTQEADGMLLFLKIKDIILSSDPNSRYEKIQRVQDAIVAVQKEPIACTNSWRFDTAHYRKTLVTEFLLVCNNEWLPRTSNTLFWMGSLVGNLFFGWISDRYGRRPTILLMIFFEVPLCILASFPGNYWGYIVLRILGGLFFPALYQQPFILALELMPPATRTHTGIVVGMLFASGMCLLALLAFLLRDWFYLSLATSLPFILLYGCYWLIPESPRWLVGRGRIADAEKVLRNLAKKNGIILPHGFLIELHKKIKDEETEAELSIMPIANGQVPFQEKEDHQDRRINNMLTFKPEYRKNNESDIENKENLEPRISEVGDLIQKSRSPRDAECLKDEIMKLNQKDPIRDTELQQRTSQTEYSIPNSLGRKSIQLVNRILFKENEDIHEKKKMDDQNSDGDCGASPLDVFRYPNIRKKFLILTFNWTALGVVYNSLSYNTSNLGVDDYLAFFIGGAVEIPSYFIAWQCMERYGRRWVLCVFINLGGLACLSCALVPEAWPWVIVSLAMLARLCAAASFAVFYVQIGELLPTVVRAQAMGASSVVAGIGLLTVPYIVALATYSRYLPLIIMGVLSVMAGVTSLFLPETLNQPLPQTLEDGEMFGRNFKLLCCIDNKK